MQKNITVKGNIWPTINEDIMKFRENCKICREIAPSNPKLPPVPLRSPDYPIQQISADYFELEGYQFLVIIDRYSGWPVVFKMNKGNASELCSAMRQYFYTYGCAEEFTSDGGRQFESI